MKFVADIFCFSSIANGLKKISTITKKTEIFENNPEIFMGQINISFIFLLFRCDPAEHLKESTLGILLGLFG